MSGSFELELTDDVEAAVQRAQSAAERAGSVFHGDRFAGMFRGNGIEGYYRVDGSKVIVTITERPAMIPMSVIEMSMRNYFGVDASGAAEEPAVKDGVHPPRLRRRAKELVKQHALFASGAGLVPVPLADIAAVTAVQVKMLLELTRLYGESYTPHALGEFATALSGSAVARLGASAIKAIPGIGTLIGGASMSIMSGASTYAVGVVTIDELDHGREIGASMSDRVKHAYKEALDEGKELIAKVKGGGAGSDDEPT